MIIFGVGLAGLIVGLLLAKVNIRVGFTEQKCGLDEQPGVTHYTAAATYGRRRAGVLTDVRGEGFKSPSSSAIPCTLLVLLQDIAILFCLITNR